MARRAFSRRGRSAGRGRSARKTRWAVQNFAISDTLSTNVGVDAEWLSFWVKWPASMSSSSVRTIPPSEEVLPSNEPVDETWVNLIATWHALCLVPGVAGAPAVPVMNYCMGLIPFDGGEYPSFYDFANFTEGASNVAPPHPILQADDDWIIRWAWAVTAEVTIAEQLGTTEFVRSKAMRKLPAGRGVLAVIAAVNYFDVVTNAGINIGGDFRYAVRSGFYA